MSEPNVTNKAIKRLFIISTVLSWGVILSIFAILTWGLSEIDPPQGAIVAIGLLPIVAFVLILWVVIAVACAITMFATRSRSKSSP